MEIKIALDESGNFGIDGDYIVVGGIQISDDKPLKNFMKNQELRFQNKHPKNFKDKEIKHTNSFPAMRYYYIQKNCRKIRSNSLLHFK